jgi:steroid delta-isomerase-like uncharacterized protein
VKKKMRKFGKIVSYLILIIAFTVLMGFMAECESNKVVTEENKAIIGRFAELWNTGNLAIADEIFDADFVNHDPNDPGVTNLESYKGYVPAVRIGFPDINIAADDLVAEEEKVAFRYTINATHQGELMGMPATGIQVVWTGITVAHLADGKIMEMWWAKDTLGMLQQLGVIPPMGPVDFTWGTPSEVTGTPGDPAANKKIFHRTVDDFWNHMDVGVIDELYATDYLGHDPSGLHGTTLEEMKQSAAGLFTAFPDFHLILDDEIAEGDKIAKRWTVTGTHKGEFMGIPPTGNHIAITGISFYRFADGKVVETWWSQDARGILQQLGVIPPLG